MPIVANDLFLKRSELMDDTASSGGRVSHLDLSSSLLPAVTGLQRQAGLTRYRKFFVKNENTDGVVDYTYLTLYNSMVWLKDITPAGDYVVLKAGTGDDVRSDAEGYTNWAGVGRLYGGGTTSSVVENIAAAGDTYIWLIADTAMVDTELFQDGGTVVISDGTNRETITVTTVTKDPGVVGDDTVIQLYFPDTPLLYTYYSRIGENNGDVPPKPIDPITVLSSTATTLEADSLLATWTPSTLIGRQVRIISGGCAGQVRRIVGNGTDTLEVEYAWTGTPPAASDTFEVLKTYVSQAIELGDIRASYDSAGVVADGTINQGATDGRTGNIRVYPDGTVDAWWRLSVASVDSPGGVPTSVNIYRGTDASTFEATPIATGVECDGVDITLTNPGSGYYFQVKNGFFVSGWDVGETCEFETISGGAGVWCKQVVPVPGGTPIDPHLDCQFNIDYNGDTV